MKDCPLLWDHTLNQNQQSVKSCQRHTKSKCVGFCDLSETLGLGLGTPKIEDRINRLNSTYLLKLMGKDKEHVVVGNGAIWSKAEIAEFKKQLGDADAEDVTVQEGGGQPTGPKPIISEATKKDGAAMPTPRAGMGDNMGNGGTKTTTPAESKKLSKPANQKPSEPKLKSADSSGRRCPETSDLHEVVLILQTPLCPRESTLTKKTLRVVTITLTSLNV